jgi:glutamate-1-semialdehyde 2,1-aminomutase
MSFGVHVLGHGPETVLKVLHEQCELGMSYGAPHTREVEFTQRFIASVPCAELAMVCNAGTESTIPVFGWLWVAVRS